MCFSTVTFNGHEMSTDDCRARWESDRRARRGPLPCSPAELIVMIGSASAGRASELPLPDSLVRDVTRTGKTRVTYEAEACATDDGGVVVAPKHATGFADLDDILHGKATEVTLSPGTCAPVTLLASRFECEVEPALH
jgi:hypothetical protein